MRTTLILLLGMSASIAVASPTPFDSPSSEFQIVSESASGLTVIIDVGSQLSDAMSGCPELSGAIPDFDEIEGGFPSLTRLLAVPQGHRATVNARVIAETRSAVDPYSSRDNQTKRALRETSPLPLVEIGEPVWIRWMRVAPVVIRPSRIDSEQTEIVTATSLELEFTFVPDAGRDAPAPDPDKYYSLAFEEFFRGTLLNPASLPHIPPYGRKITRGSYVIITSPRLVIHVQKFADWKRRKGFDVVVAPIIDRAGVSNEEVLAYIRNAWETWERPPEFVLLLGDPTRGSERLPSYFITSASPWSERVNTDLPYSLMQGNDYFPDLFIGRLSVDNSYSGETLIALNRMVKYEQDSTGTPRDRFHKATIFAGNHSDTGVPISTPVATMEWLARNLRERGWEVDTFYHRNERSNIPSRDIVNSINRGVNLVSYRGWGDAGEAHFPQFGIDQINQLQNGPLLPLMTFFVCNSADFGNETYDPGYGDKTLFVGTRVAPAGAIAFVGPTHLHTKTRINNPMTGGFYAGALFENMRNVSSLVLRGKMEVWRSMPLEREMVEERDNAYFYFSTYHLLGDPDLNYFFDAPKILTVYFEPQFAVGARDAEFTVLDESRHRVKGALVHLSGRGVDCSFLTDAEGVAHTTFDLLEADTLQLTILAHQARPYLASIPVVPPERLVRIHHYAVRNNDGDTMNLPVGRADVEIFLENVGQGDENSVLFYFTEWDGCQVIDWNHNIGAMAAGGDPVRMMAQLDIPADFYDGGNVCLQARIIMDNGTSQTTKYSFLRIPVRNQRLILDDFEIVAGSLNPGAEASLNVTLHNSGRVTVSTTGIMDSFDEAVEILERETDFGWIEAGQSVVSASPFRLRIRPGTAIGRQIQLRIALQERDDPKGKIFFPITVGNPGPRDPLGPEGYGYYAYDNSDNHPNAPRYEWLELDPAYGGSGARLDTLDDDEVFQLDLPFAFKFYGIEYDEATISSNGWLAFDPLADVNFVNHNIPGPLGPRALIAAYWDDLVGDKPTARRDSLRVLTRHDRQEGRFIVEWSRVYSRSDTSNETQTFEAILFDPAVRATPTGDGEILFQYREVSFQKRENDPNYATIGIEDTYHRRGLEITYTNLRPAAVDEIVPGRAIRITTVPPDTFLVADKQQPSLPSELALYQPHPNPFNGTVSLSFMLLTAGEINLSVYDLGGRLVTTLVNGRREAGEHKVAWDGGNAGAGVYIVRLKAGGVVKTQKVVLAK